MLLDGVSTTANGRGTSEASSGGAGDLALGPALSFLLVLLLLLVALLLLVLLLALLVLVVAVVPRSGDGSSSDSATDGGSGNLALGPALTLLCKSAMI